MPWPSPSWPKLFSNRPGRSLCRAGRSPEMSLKPFFTLFLLLTLLVTGCSRDPLSPVPALLTPGLEDDLDLDSLKEAVARSLSYLEKQPPSATVTSGASPITGQILRETLLAFQRLLDTDPSPAELAHQVRRQFRLYRARGVGGFNPFRKMLVTGYYEPLFDGSLTRQPPFLHPLYTIPSDLVIRSESSDENDGKIGNIGRFDKTGRFVPYWNRREIETQGRCSGAELVWLRDPLDCFFLQVQGSGRIRLRDGSIRGVHYRISNGLPYSSIGKYMVETGRISLQEASLQTIRRYIVRHPDERNEILHHNEKFVFFHWSEAPGAVGNLGEVLTPGRSVAADQSVFPAGGLGFLITRQPRVDREGRITGRQPVQRFVLIQDKGSAITGAGRIDLFQGNDAGAEQRAGAMKEAGKFYLLVKKNETTRG